MPDRGRQKNRRFAVERFELFSYAKTFNEDVMSIESFATQWPLTSRIRERLA